MKFPALNSCFSETENWLMKTFISADAWQALRHYNMHPSSVFQWFGRLGVAWIEIARMLWYSTAKITLMSVLVHSLKGCKLDGCECCYMGQWCVHHPYLATCWEELYLTPEQLHKLVILPSGVVCHCSGSSQPHQDVFTRTDADLVWFSSLVLHIHSQQNWAKPVLSSLLCLGDLFYLAIVCACPCFAARVGWWL